MVRLASRASKPIQAYRAIVSSWKNEKQVKIETQKHFDEEENKLSMNLRRDPTPLMIQLPLKERH